MFFVHRAIQQLSLHTDNYWDFDMTELNPGQYFWPFIKDYLLTHPPSQTQERVRRFVVPPHTFSHILYIVGGWIEKHHRIEPPSDRTGGEEIHVFATQVSGVFGEPQKETCYYIAFNLLADVFYLCLRQDPIIWVDQNRLRLRQLRWRDHPFLWYQGDQGKASFLHQGQVVVVALWYFQLWKAFRRRYQADSSSVSIYNNTICLHHSLIDHNFRIWSQLPRQWSMSTKSFVMYHKCVSRSNELTAELGISWWLQLSATVLQEQLLGKFLLKTRHAT